MRPGLHFFAPRGGRVINNYFGGMPMLGMGEYWRMQAAMFNCMKPMLIGGMISNIGRTIAGLISGNGGGQCNCGCGGGYNDMLSQTMYPYVNLTNTRQTTTNNNTTNVEGKGGSDSISNDLKILKDTYKGYKISGPTSTGEYFIKGKDGVPIKVDSYEDLVDKLNELAESENELKVQEEDGKVSQEAATPTTPAASAKPVASRTPAKPTKPVAPTKPKPKTEVVEDEKPEKPVKYKDQGAVNYAVDELIAGIEGPGTNPDKITNILRNKGLFNKNNVVPILDTYNQKTKNQLWMAIDNEWFYYSDSKLEDYQLIVDRMYERAQQTVKDKTKLKKVEAIYNAMQTIKPDAKFDRMLTGTVFVKQFEEAMQILKDAEPKE